jgi:hypothetical protein
MKTIEAYMVINLEGGRSFFNEEYHAERIQEQYGGTIVKLTGEELPKKSKLLAPCLYKSCEDIWVSDKLFESEQEAKNLWGDMLVAWPAIPDKNGFYTVEET